MSGETDERNGNSGRAEDAALGNHYRAIADETPPQSLDQAVLGRARRAATRSRSLFGPAGWYRPAAFAATLVLGVFMLLQLSEIGILQPITANAPDETVDAAVPVRSFPEAAEREAARIRSLAEGSNSSNSSDNTRTASPGPAMMSPAERSPAPDRNARDGCSEAEESTAGSWYRCILALEDAGFSQAAEREMNELLKAYPRFALPAQP